ncbi:glycosyltransferase [Flavobacterium sp. SUN052]|uniref:glycosyltransferase family 2 protein n=1 Tax=Flavobacterium sp. SUN052 TaxID=3002441 RepID=UPI00237E92BD|nr:glycosyltransferase [Flavobacterium sp. SUN052]MEC4004432.1 glycosyltransferase [Flavobacterium sp. SUN052]
MITIPTVSVCMITYGHENFIEDAINGVLMQQTNFEIELLISNDCSPDATDDVIQRILQNHPKASLIKYTNHKQNIGMMPNFVSTLKKCVGKYIALCDGDDYWTDPLKLQKQVDFLELNSEFSSCYHKVKIQYPDGKIIHDYIKFRPDSYDDLQSLINSPNTIATPSLVFRNNIINYPDEFVKSPVGDIFLFYLLCEKGKIKFIEEEMCVYRFGVGIYSANSEYIKHYQTIEFLVLFYNYYSRTNDSLSVQAIISKKIFEFYKRFASEIKKDDLNFLFENKSLVKSLIDNYNSERITLESKNIEYKTWSEILKILVTRLLNKVKLFQKKS